MADGVDLSSFDQAPAAKGVSLSSFDAPAAAPAAPQGKSVSLSQFDAPQDQPIETRVWSGIKSAATNALGMVMGAPAGQQQQYGEGLENAAEYLGSKTMQSPVGSLIRGLNKGEQFVSGLAADATVKSKAALNPNDKWFPDIAFHDVVNYMAPSNDRVQKTLEDYGFTGNWAQSGRLLYATAKTGIGLAADLATDPLMYVGAGELTEAGKAAEVSKLNAVADGTATMEQVSAPSERYALSFGAGKAKVGVTTDQASSAIKAIPGGNAALSGASKAVSKVGDVVSALDYRTGVPEVDAAASLHAGFKRGDYQVIDNDFVAPIKAMKLTPGENGVLAAAIEATPNGASKDEILSAARDAADRMNVQVPDDRLGTVADAGTMIKAENAKDLAEREAAGFYKPGVDPTIENYLVHKISPAAKAAMADPAKAAAIQEALLQFKSERASADSILSTYDSGKQARQLRTTLEQANQILKEKTGIASFFIEDPTVATALKRADTRRLVRDSELIDRIEKFGTEKQVAKEAGLQWKPINIPEYEGALPSKNLVFPPTIADKIGYYITPRETRGFLPWLDTYNRVYRNFALATPYYYARNWGENLFKNWVQGVKIEDYLDVHKISSEKGAIEIGGKTVPVSDIRKQILQYGIDSGGQYKEGITSWMDAGKKMESDRKFARVATAATEPLKKAVTVLKEGGEYGENYARRALFVNRLKTGFSPGAAALEVEKYLFDYTRTSSRMDAMRRFWNPFFQHAYKTLMITPEMLATAPGKYNFLHNNMLQAVQAGINDPVSAAEVKAILPQYSQVHDPVVGPILTGNSWLRRIFTNQTAVGGTDGKLGTAMLFTHDIGLSILNQFALWDNQYGRTAGTVAPLMRAFITMASGRDIMTGKIIDPTTQSADMAKRFSYALNGAVGDMVPMPNAYKFVKQQLGIGDPKYFTPNGVLALHAALGKFVNVTDLDREYFFRMLAFNAAHKELTHNLMSALAAESSGRTADLALSSHPYLSQVNSAIHGTESAAYLYNKLHQNDFQTAVTQDAARGLQGQMTSVDIVKHLKDLEKTIEAQGKQYEAVQQYRLEALRNAPKAEVRAMAPGSNP